MIPPAFSVRKVNMAYSSSAVEKLGKRLKLSEVSEESDLAMLQVVIAEYEEVRRQVAQLISQALGVKVTSRLKTVTTIIEKLKRENTRLNTMQDIAGVRLVLGPGDTRTEQDKVVDCICTLFPDHRVSDRRMAPSFGYRAVHVVVKVEGRPVEVQVRTQMQDLWAQTFERVADQWGREIRYGAGPREPDAVVVPGVTRHDMVAVLAQLSKQIEEVETTEASLRAEGVRMGALGSRIAELEVLREGPGDPKFDELKESYLRLEAGRKTTEQAETARRNELRSLLTLLAKGLETLFGGREL